MIWNLFMHASFSNIKGTDEDRGGLCGVLSLAEVIRPGESLDYRLHLGILPYSPLPVQCQGWTDTPGSQEHKLPMPHYHQDAKQ